MQNRSTQQWDKRSLTVLALSVLVVLLFSFGCLLSYQKLRSERQDQERAEAQRMLLAFEAHSTRLFDYADGQLRAIRAFVNEHGTTEKLASFINEIKAPRAELFADVVTIIDRDGWFVYQSGTPREQLKALGKMSDLDHYQYFITHPGDSLFVGPTRPGKVTGKMQYRMARPIFKNGVFDGLVVLSLLPEYITDFYRSTSLGPHSNATMLTQKQWLIARQPEPAPGMYGSRVSNPINKGRTEPGQGGSVFGFVSSFDQSRRDVFFKNLANYPVTLTIGVAEQDRDDALAGVRRNLSLLAAAFTVSSMLVCTLVLRLFSKNRRLVTAEITSRQSLSELRRLSDSIQTVKEHERKRIAQDIHDELGQNLLVLKMDVVALYARTRDAHPKLNQRASLVLNNIDATIKSVKSIMNDLRPAALELGLFAGVEWQLKQFMRTSDIDCKLVATEGGTLEFDLDEKKSAAVFRIFQESLTNVARHAQATKVEVTLRRDEHGFLMTIKDNGKGLEPGDRSKPNSFGLRGIEERAHALEAEFAIESTENGTALSIFITMKENSV